MDIFEMEIQFESSRSKRKNIVMRNIIRNFLMNYKLFFELGYIYFIVNCYVV